jgi:hypothetical protein
MQDFIETQEIYTNLFKGYAIMPEDDVRKNIEQLGTKYKTTSWASFKSHLERMKSTLEESALSPKRRIWVSECLALQIKDFNYYQNIPELRPYINEGDRGELERRRLVLESGGFYNNEEDLWKKRQAKGEVADWRSIPAEIIVAIDAKLKMLDDKLTRSLALARLAVQMPVANDVPDKKTTSAALNSLFRLSFTVNHCDALMRKVLVGPGFNLPTHLSAKIWALLFVLDNAGLLACSPADAARTVGQHYGYAMAGKPSKVQISKPYKEAFSRLSAQVKEDMANKYYGPYHA